MKKKSKLSKRITWRVILIMMFFNVFIIGAVFIFDLAMSLLQSETRAQHLIDGIEGKLVTMLRAVEVASTNNVSEIEDNLESPEKVFEAMEHELRLNNRYIGCGVAFEPDYFKTQDRWFEPYVKFVDSTHVERKQIGSAQHDYFKQEWYKRGYGMEKGHGYLSDPYLDKDGGMRILSTYSTPIFNHQGHKVGVYGIDLDLNWLEKTVINEENKVKKTEGVENDPDDPDDDENAFFIQILDSKGMKIAGSEAFDDKTLHKILNEDSIGFEKMKMNDITYYVTSKRITSTGWTLIVAQHRDFVLLSGYMLGIIILFFMTVGGIVIFFFTSRCIKSATKPLGFLSESAQEVARGNFDTPLPTFKNEDEIAQLRDSFDTMQQSLKQFVEELKETTASKATIESELNVAHSIQMSMLPKTFPAFPNRKDIDIYGSLTPAKAVGGDLYDFFIHDEKLFFCIGDVSGKGVPASLVMAVSRTLFRNIAMHVAKPSLIAETMNANLSKGNEESMFVTFFVGVLDLQTGCLCYCNAGHNAPFVQCSMLDCNPNIPIGVMPDWKFTEQEMVMAPGTTIFLYTDGLTEAENANLEQFGEERVTNVVTTQMADDASPQTLIEAMSEAVHQFVGNTEQSDDLTMLAIKYTIKH